MLTDGLILLNRGIGHIADVALAPIAWLPGWLSLTMIGLFTGVVLLWVFQRTSNQTAIQRTRTRIRGNLIALSLFRDEPRVCLRCQGAILCGAARLLTHSLIPMLVMALPVLLLLGHLSLWYQARPLSVGEEAVVTVHLAKDVSVDSVNIDLMTSPAVHIVAGPVRIPSRQMVCWSLAGNSSGHHQLNLQMAGHTATKELAVGMGFMPVSQKRPGRNLVDMLEHPREVPFAQDSPVQSIEIGYPSRNSWLFSAQRWIGYWFLISLFSAVVVKPVLKVQT